MSKPTASRVTAVRTPGAPEAEGDEPKATLADLEAQEQAFEAELLSGADTEVSSDVVEPAAAPPAVAPDLQALIDAAVAKGVAQAMASRSRAESSPVHRAELPDQNSVDAFEIKQEVLTKQGFVVPHAYPQPAGLPNALR